MKVPSVQSSATAFEWVSTHAHMLGWGFIIGLCVKIIRFFTRVEDRFKNAESTLQTVANNHLVHIEASMANVDRGIAEMREDLKGLRDDIKDFSLAVINK